MPIPPKKKEEATQPEMFSWQSFVFMGLLATAATGSMIAKGGFRMNRNLNVMQRFVHSHSDKLGKLVEHTPSGENMDNIIQTAQKIAEDKVPEEKDQKHAYPKPTFPTRTLHKRELFSSQRKEGDDKNQAP